MPFSASYNNKFLSGINAKLILLTISLFFILFSCQEQSQIVEQGTEISTNDIDEENALSLDIANWNSFIPMQELWENTDFTITLEPSLQIDDLAQSPSKTAAYLGDYLILLENKRLSIYENEKIVFQQDLSGEFPEDEPEIFASIDNGLLIATDQQFLLFDPLKRSTVFLKEGHLLDFILRQSKLIFHFEDKDQNLGEGTTSLIALERDGLQVEWENTVSFSAPEIYYQNGSLYGLGASNFLSFSMETGTIKDLASHNSDSILSWYLVPSSSHPADGPVAFILTADSYSLQNMDDGISYYQVESKNRLDSLQLNPLGDAAILIGEYDQDLYLSYVDLGTGAFRWQRRFDEFTMQEQINGLITLQRNSQILFINAYDGSTEFFTDFAGSEAPIRFLPGSMALGSTLYKYGIDTDPITIANQNGFEQFYVDETESLLSPLANRYEYNHEIWPYRAYVEANNLSFYRYLEESGRFFVELEKGENKMALRARLNTQYQLENLRNEEAPVLIKVLDEKNVVVQSNLQETDVSSSINILLGDKTRELLLSFVSTRKTKDIIEFHYQKLD